MGIYCQHADALPEHCRQLSARQEGRQAAKCLGHYYAPLLVFMPGLGEYVGQHLQGGPGGPDTLSQLQGRCEEKASVGHSD